MVLDIGIDGILVWFEERMLYWRGDIINIEYLGECFLRKVKINFCI